jgi:hypothetical protein
MKTIDAYKFRKVCILVEELCHNSLNRIVENMNKYPDYCKKLGEYVKLCVIAEKLCNYCCSICCNCQLSDHLLNECKLKCNLMIKCCKVIKKTKMTKKDMEYISCEKMIKTCQKLMKMCN